MPSLSVRKIDPEVYDRLRVRAAKHGVSMEEEVRRIITSSVTAPERLGDMALHLFGEHGVDVRVPLREIHEPIGFEE